MKKLKHVLLIGGRRGIGKDYLDFLLEEKNSIVTYSGRNEIILQKVNPRLNFIRVDLADTKGRKLLVKKAVQKHGKIDHIVFLQRNRDDNEIISNEVDIMLSATSDIIDSSIEFFEPSGNKSIIVINSGLSRFASKESSLAYHLARGGIEQLVRYYAVKLGPNGIRINSVSTCTIQKFENAIFFDTEGKDRVESQKQITPGKYFGNARDISTIISFLASNSSKLINGQTIIADGGITIQWPEDLIW